MGNSCDRGTSSRDKGARSGIRGELRDRNGSHVVQLSRREGEVYEKQSERENHRKRGEIYGGGDSILATEREVETHSVVEEEMFSNFGARISQIAKPRVITDGVEYWQPPYEKSGWLEKQGEVVKTWRKRWFVMKQGKNVLVFGRTRDDADKKSRSYRRGEWGVRVC